MIYENLICRGNNGANVKLYISSNPLLIAAGFDRTNVVIPWLGRKRLRLVLG